MNNAIQKNTILIATGGTGGHIFPSLSVINQIQNHYSRLNQVVFGEKDQGKVFTKNLCQMHTRILFLQ